MVWWDASQGENMDFFCGPVELRIVTVSFWGSSFPLGVSVRPKFLATGAWF